MDRQQLRLACLDRAIDAKTARDGDGITDLAKKFEAYVLEPIAVSDSES